MIGAREAGGGPQTIRLTNGPSPASQARTFWMGPFPGVRFAHPGLYAADRSAVS